MKKIFFLLFIFNSQLTYSQSEFNFNGSYSGIVTCNSKVQFSFQLLLYTSPENVHFFKLIEKDITKKSKRPISITRGEGNTNVYGNRGGSNGINRGNIIQFKSPFSEQNESYFNFKSSFRLKVYEENSTVEIMGLSAPYCMQGDVLLTKDIVESSDYSEFINSAVSKSEQLRWEQGIFELPFSEVFIKGEKPIVNYPLSNTVNIYRFDSKEYVIYDATRTKSIVVFVPYPINDKEIIDLIGVDQTSMSNAHAGNLMMQIDSKLFTLIKIKHPRVSKINIKLYNKFDIQEIVKEQKNIKLSEYKVDEFIDSNNKIHPKIAYSLRPFNSVETGRAPNLANNIFQCGDLSAKFDDINSHRKIIVTGNEAEFYKKDIENVVCLINKMKEFISFKYSDPAYFPLEFTLNGKIIKQIKLYREYNYKYKHDLDEVIAETPKIERINLYDYDFSDPEFIEYIYYGKFQKALSMNRGFSYDASMVRAYMISLQNRHPNFLIDPVERTVTTQTIRTDDFGRQSVVGEKKETFIIEKKFNNLFEKYFDATSFGELVSAFNFLTRGTSSSNIATDMDSFNCIFSPESRIGMRFKENLYRYMNLGLESPYKGYQKGDPRPKFQATGVLIKEEIIDLEGFVLTSLVWLPVIKLSSPYKYVEELKKANIVGNVLECTYKTDNGNVIMHFWNNKRPDGLQQNLKNVPDGNPIFNGIGPPLKSSPKTLQEAIDLLVEELFGYI